MNHGGWTELYAALVAAECVVVDGGCIFRRERDSVAAIPASSRREGGSRWQLFRRAAVVVVGGGCGMGWCGRERRRRLGLGFWLFEGDRESDDVACFDW